MAATASVSVARNLEPFGDETLRIRGVFQVDTLTLAVDPLANGFTFSVYGQSGTEILNVFVPPGPRADSFSPGWIVNAAGTRWLFKDSSGTAAEGIRRVRVVHQVGKFDGLFLVSVLGKDGNFHIDPAELPLRLHVVPGGVFTGMANQCAVSVFKPASGERPNCRASRGDSSISCG